MKTFLLIFDYKIFNLVPHYLAIYHYLLLHCGIYNCGIINCHIMVLDNNAQTTDNSYEQIAIIGL